MSYCAQLSSHLWIPHEQQTYLLQTLNYCKTKFQDKVPCKSLFMPLRSHSHQSLDMC